MSILVWSVWPTPEVDWKRFWTAEKLFCRALFRVVLSTVKVPSSCISIPIDCRLGTPLFPDMLELMEASNCSCKESTVVSPEKVPAAPVQLLVCRPELIAEIKVFQLDDEIVDVGSHPRQVGRDLEGYRVTRSS